MGAELLLKENVGLVTNVDRIVSDATDFIRGNPLVAIAAIGAGATGLIAGAKAIRKRRKKKSKTRKKKAPTRRRKASKKRKTKRTTNRTKRSRSSKRIRKTKNGQPYIILPNGRAKFISKKSARIRKKRKGGYF